MNEIDGGGGERQRERSAPRERHDHEKFGGASPPGHHRGANKGEPYGGVAPTSRRIDRYNHKGSGPNHRRRSDELSLLRSPPSIDRRRERDYRDQGGMGKGGDDEDIRSSSVVPPPRATTGARIKVNRTAASPLPVAE